MRSYFLSLFSISLFLLLFPFTLHGASGNKLISNTCKSVSENNSNVTYGINVTYDFCKTSLEAVWEKYYAPNLEALGSVSLKLVKNNVTETKTYIVEQTIKAWKNNRSQHFRTCLRNCFKLHSDAVDELEKAVKNYKSQKYTEAKTEAIAALTFLTNCEGTFRSKGLVSPLTKRYKVEFKLSIIAVHILKKMEGV